MRVLKTWLLSLTALLILAACSDGSVRSPGLTGAGPLQSFQIQCRVGAGGTLGACPQNLVAGQTVDIRVLGTFADGSIRDITDQSRIEFAHASQSLDVALTGPTKGRVRAISQSQAPVPVTVTDALGEANPVSRQALFSVSGAIANRVDIIGPDGNVVQDGRSVVAGVPESFRVRVSFPSQSNVDPIVLSADENLAWSVETINNSTATGQISQSGVFTGFNSSPSDPANIRIRAVFNAPGATSPLQDTATLSVTAAAVVPGSLRLVPNPATIRLGDTQRFRAFARFTSTSVQTPGGVEREVTEALDVDIAVGDNALLEVVPANSAGDISTTVRAIGAGATIVTGTFDGESSTAAVNIPVADIAELRLTPVTGNEAVLLGLNPDGSLPCDGSGCNDGALNPDQTMPGVSLAYIVEARVEGNFEDEDEGFFRLGTSINCADQSQLPVFVAALDNNTRVDAVNTSTNPDVVQRVYLVQGLSAGQSNVRARLGRAAANNAFASGLNCRGDSVTDGVKTVTVGTNGGAQSVTGVSFDISTTSACVGYLNAVDLLEGGDARGLQLMNATLNYETDLGNIRVPVNQQRNVNFSSEYGTKDGEGEMCANFLPFDFATSPVTVTNAFNAPRGLMTTENPLSLGTSCILVSFDPRGASILGDALEADSRSATMTALPLVDDDIIRGGSALSNGQIDGLCGALGELGLFDIPGLNEGLIIDLLTLLGGTVGVLVNNDIANEFGDLIGQGLLEGLDLILGTLLDTTGLDVVLQNLLGVLGLGAESPVGFGLLTTVLDGLIDGLSTLIGLLPGLGGGDGGDLIPGLPGLPSFPSPFSVNNRTDLELYDAIAG
jgi:hypothetical protein